MSNSPSAQRSLTSSTFFRRKREPLLLRCRLGQVRSVGESEVDLDVPVHYRLDHQIELLGCLGAANHHAAGFDPALDDRPLVDHPRAFHQNGLGTDGDEMTLVVFQVFDAAEAVFPGAPAEQSIDDLKRLHAQRLDQFLFRDQSALDHHVAQPLKRLLLGVQSFSELCLGDPPRANQHGAQ